MDLLDKIEFNFFTSGLTLEYFVNIEIFLREEIKMEFAYMQTITPVELFFYNTKALDLAQKRSEAMSNKNMLNDSLPNR